MIGVGLISYFFLIHQSLQLDEAQSLWQASHSLRGLFYVVALDVHVPLYHVILHYWMLFFGHGVVAVRLLSLAFFLITIPLSYILARQILRRQWALFLVVAYSFSPFMDWYANVARMYTLLVLMSMLSIICFLRILRTGKGWLWYALVSLIGAYTHYFFLFTLASEGIFYLLNRQRFPARSLLRLLLIAAAVVVALSPWLYYFHSLGSASTTRPDLPQPSTVDFFNVFSQFFFGFQTNTVNTILLSSWPIIMLGALLAVVRNKRNNPAVNLMFTTALVPILLAYLISLTITPFFLSRYMISCVPPLFIAALWVISNYGRRLAAAVVVLVLIAGTVASYQQISSPSTPLKEHYKEAVDAINAQVQPQDLVVISTPFTIYPVEYYYTGSAQIDTLPHWNRTSAQNIPPFSAKTLPAQVAAQNAHHRYIYLLLSQDQGYENTIKHYYLTHFKQLSKTSYSNDLTLYVYKVGYYTVPPITKAPAQ